MTSVESKHVGKNLMPSERMISVTRPHLMVLVAPGLLVLLGILVSIGGFMIGGSAVELRAVGICLAGLGLLLTVAVGGRAIRTLIDCLSSEYGCTNKRIVFKTGFGPTKVKEIPLERIDTIHVNQDMLGKLFGYGTLVLKGNDRSVTAFQNIRGPADFYKHIHARLARIRK